MGKEFYNTDVQRLMKKHNINHYSTYSVLKASVVERFNRTLKDAMWKMFTLNGSYKWMSCRDLCRITTQASNDRKVIHRTTEVFKIVKVQRINPVTYLLKNYRGKSIAGAFYEYELRLTNYPDEYVEKVLRRKGDEIYVKWLGFDGLHNSWIHKDNVV
ncbi:uncharacterized protein LOC126851928 [Cataglyphis hispanica]|uniref:uncharacterized protein LOC126851928 n=1 Tax=Cataglyphis hispanica TaxID=1086592 RepID=UPI002180886F|nr:uncharacterized protein LOC126851928 [Cataglyphis hispanica]